MNAKTFFGFFAVFFLFMIVGNDAETIKYEMCPQYENKCTIDEVRVNPCKESAKNKPCKIKKGDSAAISFDFTPSFDSETFTVLPYWAGIKDAPFITMDTDACKFATCPVKSGTQQTYTYYLNVSKSFPSNVYPLKWKLADADAVVKCCFKFTIILY